MLWEHLPASSTHTSFGASDKRECTIPLKSSKCERVLAKAQLTVLIFAVATSSTSSKFWTWTLSDLGTQQLQNLCLHLTLDLGLL